MAGSSMTFEYDDGHDRTGLQGAVRRVVCDWVSDDATGAVEGVTEKIVGEMLKAVTVPSDTDAPTASYDIALADEDGGNPLANATDDLGDRHDSNTETVEFLLSDGGGTPLPIAARPVLCSKLTISVSNAGNAKAGRLVLFYR